jgi:hypothetical protein
VYKAATKITSCAIDKSDYSRLIQNPSKLLLLNPNGRALKQLIAPMISREMSECEMARARWMRQKFSSITLAQRMVSWE